LAWAIELTPEAVKALAHLGNEGERRVVRFLRERVSRLDDPRTIGEPLKGSHFAGLWRYRAGDYRILCDIQDERVTILVVLVGHRREVYR
jgi:mRNA interferase RelE/StbE